jgi:uncharacterized membrane protein YozB (DUF420 family)
MITGFLHMHSALRWVALVLLVLVVVKSVQGSRGNAPFTEGQRKLGLFTMIALHLQLVLGLMLYMMRGWIGVLGQEGTMSNSYARFFAMEHATLMVVAIVLGTLGYSLSKRAADDAAKHKKQALFFGLCLLLILLGIPWPFRPGFEQVGWF